MESMHNAWLSSHNGISYSAIIIFGAFVFLTLVTLLNYSGRVTEVMRKAGFFAMILLYMQALLGFLVAFSAPEFGSLMGEDAYFQHFKYALSILICAILVMVVYFNIKKNDVLEIKFVVLTLIAALIFEYAYPWSNIFGV